MQCFVWATAYYVVGFLLVALHDVVTVHIVTNDIPIHIYSFTDETTFIMAQQWYCSHSLGLV